MISKQDAKLLINLAKDAISSRLNNTEPKLSEQVKKISEKKGVFVTLTIKDELRGCIGFPYPVYPLYKAVIKAAISAAFDDSRFLQLTKEELEQINIEISVLTEPELIGVDNPEEYLKRITIGKDGLIIKSKTTSGLLLPQVPIEWNWEEKEFLEHLCLKASLYKDSWKEQDVEIYKFQAQIFKSF